MFDEIRYKFLARKLENIFRQKSRIVAWKLIKPKTLKGIVAVICLDGSKDECAGTMHIFFPFGKKPQVDL